MDKSTKTALIVIGSIFLLCACAVGAVFVGGVWSLGHVVRWVDNGTTEDPQEAVRVGSEIADFEIPQGFDSPYGVHLGDVYMVGYTSQSKQAHILIAQFPKGTSINVDEMLRQISENTSDPNSIWYNTETELVEQKTVNIRGEECTLNISEGTLSDDVEFRMATAKFEGRGGPSLVMIAGPLGEWDTDMVEDFISSLE
jgi:hypothetical protein